MDRLQLIMVIFRGKVELEFEIDFWFDKTAKGRAGPESGPVVIYAVYPSVPFPCCMTLCGSIHVR